MSSNCLIVFIIFGLIVVAISKEHCQILIAGGSLSATAAAITAVNVTLSEAKSKSREKLHVCLLEPTNWPGGQLATVPPDFGIENRVIENLPRSFVNLLLSITNNTWNENPGFCWVSTNCFKGTDAVKQIMYILDSMSEHLTVYYNTVVVSTVKDPITGKITSVTSIQRTPVGNYSGWDNLLSTDLPDWYSPKDSKYFSKKILSFEDFKVVIDATELGDVLMTSDIAVQQGVEAPAENSTEAHSTCGQMTVFPFVISYGNSKVDPKSPDIPPKGSDLGVPFTLQGLTWGQVWSYRRVLATLSSVDFSVGQGEWSNQNLDNDAPLRYILSPLHEAKQQVKMGQWSGGLDLKALREAEQRSFGWFHFLVESADPEIKEYLYIQRHESGTGHGLSKFPYIRDTRRVKSGLQNFRLTYADLNFSNPDNDGATAMHFPDTVGIGVYLYADVHRLSDSTCPSTTSTTSSTEEASKRSPLDTYPAYITNPEKHPVKPYYIPFRSLTTSESSNLLVSGKTMAQTFLANAATRLHPTEWASGVATGAAAVLMASNGFTSTDMLDNISMLQNTLKSDSVFSPLEWKLSTDVQSELLKATWLPVQYNCSSAESVLATFQGLKEIGVERVYVDVWNNGKTYFRSNTMLNLVGPTGVSNDLLGWALFAGKSTGIEVVAWFEYGLMTSYGGINNDFARVAESKGWILGSYNNFVWMDPSQPEVIEFLSDIVKDCILEYAQDNLLGIQMDDHFASPSTLGGSISVMNNAMKTIYHVVKGTNTSMLVSVSPSPLDTSLPTYSANWSAWAENGLFDEVIPQLYRTTFDAFKSAYDLTTSSLGSEGLRLWRASGLRLDGSGESTSWTDLEKMLSYSTSDSRGVAIWYARGMLETYPNEMKAAWG